MNVNSIVLIVVTCILIGLILRCLTAGQETSKQALHEIVILPAIRPEVRFFVSFYNKFTLDSVILPAIRPEVLFCLFLK